MADDKFTRRTRSRVETEQQNPNPPANEQTLQMTPVEPIGTLQPTLGAVGVNSNEINSQIMSRTRSGVETEQQEPDPSVNEQISKMTSVEPTLTLQPNLGAVGVHSIEINSVNTTSKKKRKKKSKNVTTVDPNTPANEQTLQMTPAEPIGTLQPNLGAVVADSNEENDPACEPLVSQICRQSTNSVLEFRDYVYYNTSVSFGGGAEYLHFIASRYAKGVYG
jgi:ribosomal protein L11